MALPGEKHPNAVLTERKVRAMRRLYWCKRINQTCLARLYGVAVGTVHDVVNYVTWHHVADSFKADEIVREGP